MRCGLDGQVAKEHGMLSKPRSPLLKLRRSNFKWLRLLPEQIADKMILANVVGEEVDSPAGSECVEVRTAKHVRFADNARCDRDGVDGGVELCMCRGEEQLVETTTERA